ncbi:hypothetical protein GOBAR_DD14102 [Gossypium barbadense]|nr:hypothetical protein GOBAR_DD14102 [Gossypium barbadense]
MSAAVGIFLASKQDGLKKNERNNNEEAREEKKNNNKKFVDDNEAKNNNVDDENEADEEDDDPKLKPEKELDLGPPLSLCDDESLRRWKEQLLGSVDMSALGEVKIERLSIVCRGRPDIVLPIPFVSNPKSSLFILKEVVIVSNSPSLSPTTLSLVLTTLTLSGKPVLELEKIHTLVC